MAMTEKNAARREAGSDLEAGANPVPRYFVVLFAGLAIWAVLFIAYFLLSGWSSGTEFAQKMAAHRQQVEAGKPGPGNAATAAVDPEALRAEGDKLFAENCSACHGDVGEGGIGPALTAPEYKYGRDLAAVKTSIAGGRPGGMPAFGNQLSAAQIEALASHIQALGSGR